MMNLNKRTICVVLLGIFALIFALHAEAQAAISPFCAVEHVPLETQASCTELVGGAKTWDQAALASVKQIAKSSRKAVKPLLATIEAQLSPSIPIAKKSQIMDICKKSYNEVIRDLKKCPGLISNGPFISYVTVLTSIYTSMDDCKQAIVEEKVQPEIVAVTTFTQSIQKLVEVALVISKKDPRATSYDDLVRNGGVRDSAGDPNLIGPPTPGTIVLSVFHHI